MLIVFLPDYWISYIIQKLKEPSKAHQLKLEVIIKALKWLEIDMDLDEVLSKAASPSLFVECSCSIDLSQSFEFYSMCDVNFTLECI